MMWEVHQPPLVHQRLWGAVMLQTLLTQRPLTLVLLLVLMTSLCPASHNQGIVFRDDNNDTGECRPRVGGVGECRELFSCPALMKTFKTVRPAVCGFKGFTPIVCCPKPPHDAMRPQLTSTEPSILLPPTVDFECGRRSGGRRPPTRSEVVGGKEATRNAWPWVAAVGRMEHKGRVNWFCDGVLITPEVVLSAAHCVTYSSVDVVRLGGHNLKTRTAYQVDVRVATAALHPLYRPPSFAHDLALLRLAKSVTLTPKVMPVCLPWVEQDAPSLYGRRLTLTGWGDTAFGSGMSDVLREVVVTVFPTTQCDATYNTSHDYSIRFPNGVTSDFLCAGDRRGGKDACRGDSGGPLVYNTFGRYMLAAVVTGGRGCGAKDYPGIYAAIRPHLQWIRDVAFSRFP